MRVRLDAVQGDRAAGVLLGAACGDALGVPYEFGSRRLDGEPRMVGGGLGPYAPGEYSDDTQMAVCIAEVAATGVDLRSDQALDAIARNFVRWAAGGASDMGNQTRAVLGRMAGLPDAGLGAAMTSAAAELHRRTGHTAGNGSLMRTAPVALAYLDDPQALAEAARAVSDLTHADPLAGDACVIWCEAIRQAVLGASYDGVRAGLDLVPQERRGQWESWLDEAQQHPPARFNPNGFVVTALQAAWSAISRTPIAERDHPADGLFRCDQFRDGLYAAVGAGNDTDTVAAIAGGLLGARWGVSGIPLDWQRLVHGWGGHRSADLIRMALMTTGGGQPDRVGWPGCDMMVAPIDQPLMTAHPDDDGVVLGNLLSTGTVDAVVSLCRVGRKQFPDVPAGDQVQVWLVDQPGANANTAYALDQAARMVRSMRAEGKTVLLHCAAGQSRTPAVGARYAMLHAGRTGEDALARMRELLADHGFLVNSELKRVVSEFG